MSLNSIVTIILSETSEKYNGLSDSHQRAIKTGFQSILLHKHSWHHNNTTFDHVSFCPCQQRVTLFEQLDVALKSSQSPFILFLDKNTYTDRESILHLTQALLKNPDLGLAYGTTISKSDEGGYSALPLPSEERCFLSTDPVERFQKLFSAPFKSYLLNGLFRKSCLEKMKEILDVEQNLPNPIDNLEILFLAKFMGQEKGMYVPDAIFATEKKDSLRALEINKGEKIFFEKQIFEKIIEVLKDLPGNRGKKKKALQAALEYLAPDFLLQLPEEYVDLCHKACREKKADRYPPLAQNKCILYAEATPEEHQEIIRRAQFYIGEEVEFLEESEYDNAHHTPPKILRFGDIQAPAHALNIDWNTSPFESGSWITLLNYMHGSPCVDMELSRKLFYKYFRKIHKYDKVYIFGTGPSLEKAIERDWSDGYRVVCNTIVRDKELWDHIKPHVIFAGDYNYHFGCAKFAVAFRSDLEKRLAETDTLFCYPQKCDLLVRKKTNIEESQLIPIPSTPGLSTIHDSIATNFTFPSLGNSISYMLSLGCALSKNVFLWGYDGRAPTDTLFWQSSPKHYYLEHMPELQQLYPKFFEHYLPQKDKDKYVKDYFGDRLENALLQAEKKGWTFTMMHKTWTETLAKRIKGHP